MTLRQFLNRPLGGIELEIVLGCAAVLWAAPLLLAPEAVWNVRALQSFYGEYPHWLFALPWLSAGTATLVGLDLFRRSVKISRYLRMAGSFVGMVTWGWVFAKSLLTTGVDASFLGIYFLFAVASFRALISSSREWRAPPWLIG